MAEPSATPRCPAMALRMRIPEVNLEVKAETGDGQDERQELLYPANPGSNYL